MLLKLPPKSGYCTGRLLAQYALAFTPQAVKNGACYPTWPYSLTTIQRSGKPFSKTLGTYYPRRTLCRRTRGNICLKPLFGARQRPKRHGGARCFAPDTPQVLNQAYISALTGGTNRPGIIHTASRQCRFWCTLCVYIQFICHCAI